MRKMHFRACLSSNRLAALLSRSSDTMYTLAERNCALWRAASTDRVSRGGVGVPIDPGQWWWSYCAQIKHLGWSNHAPRDSFYLLAPLGTVATHSQGPSISLCGLFVSMANLLFPPETEKLSGRPHLRLKDRLCLAQRRQLECHDTVAKARWNVLSCAQPRPQRRQSMLPLIVRN